SALISRSAGGMASPFFQRSRRPAGTPNASAKAPGERPDCLRAPRMAHRTSQAGSRSNRSSAISEIMSPTVKAPGGVEAGGHDVIAERLRLRHGDELVHRPYRGRKTASAEQRST